MSPELHDAATAATTQHQHAECFSRAQLDAAVAAEHDAIIAIVDDCCVTSDSGDHFTVRCDITDAIRARAGKPTTETVAKLPPVWTQELIDEGIKKAKELGEYFLPPPVAHPDSPTEVEQDFETAPQHSEASLKADVKRLTAERDAAHAEIERYINAAAGSYKRPEARAVVLAESGDAPMLAASIDLYDSDLRARGERNEARAEVEKLKADVRAADQRLADGFDVVRFKTREQRDILAEALREIEKIQAQLPGGETEAIARTALAKAGLE